MLQEGIAFLISLLPYSVGTWLWWPSHIYLKYFMIWISWLFPWPHHFEKKQPTGKRFLSEDGAVFTVIHGGWMKTHYRNVLSSPCHFLPPCHSPLCPISLDCFVFVYSFYSSRTIALTHLPPPLPTPSLPPLRSPQFLPNGGSETKNDQWEQSSAALGCWSLLPFTAWPVHLWNISTESYHTYFGILRSPFSLSPYTWNLPLPGRIEIDLTR